jgi:hypothetical protein
LPIHPNVRPQILNAMFKANALTFPTTWWVALHSTSLSTANLPTTATEVARANGYARMGVSTANWTSATTAVALFNSTGIQFPDPTANWTTIYAVSLHDSSVTSGGGASTCWWFANVATTVNVSAGNPIRFSSATLRVSFDTTA